MRQRTVFLGLLFTFSNSEIRKAFVAIRQPSTPTPSRLFLAKASKKKKKGSGSTAGVKGFGISSSSGSSSQVNLDRSKTTLTFYNYLEQKGAGDNLKRSALGYFPLSDTVRLRGVVARNNAKKGDVLIRIPYDLAVNLGPEGEDPTLPAVTLLRDYCEALRHRDDEHVARKEYYAMLPPFRGDDCLGSTDFFSDEALDALQAPIVKDETLRRRALTQARFDQDVASDPTFPLWIDGETTVSREHLQWAVWLITSRVLTVQGDADEQRSYRLLIPFLDMCNHDRSSPHVLTGRAVLGGELKVVAGANVQEGEQINICYGGGVAGNDRFLQDYGFLDKEMAFDYVAQQVLGKRRILEGAGAGQKISAATGAATLKALRATTIDEDEGLLAQAENAASDLQLAITYRIGVKKALSKHMDMT